MSGIAGVIVPAGQSVDEPLLRRMAASLTGRGPDGQHTWVAGRAGLVHTLLRTSNESAAPQPATLDGHVWITADARIDARADLVRALEAAGRSGVSPTDDALLILHAYEAWGESCVEHLIGDFAFAIWDARVQRVFCSRDHFGVKPLYYAEVDAGLVFSNTLDCLRLHPGVSDALNELSIADFLLFGSGQDTAATAFAAVRRLPPAHVLSGAADAPVVRRYWTLPVDGRIRYRRSRDYVEHFRELLRDAVADRIGGSGASIWLSGGLDSTAIAITARQIIAAGDRPFELAGDTVIYDTLFPDDERHYAALGADAAGISPRYWVGDDAAPFEGFTPSGVRTPEPLDDPYFSFQSRQLQTIAASSRTALAGDGGDELLWRSYAIDLIGRMPLAELGLDLARSMVMYRRRPAGGVRAKLESWRRPDVAPALPSWLNADLANRWHLRERVEQASRPIVARSHAIRPEAYERLSSTAWPTYLERADPGFTGVAVEHRWPFLDIRLVNYALAIPPLPWCIDKQLLRSAMRDSLPEPLLRRKKTPLADDPLRLHLQRADWPRLNRFEAAPQLAQFVDRSALPQVGGVEGSQNPWLDLRPFCLNYWLSRERESRRVPDAANQS